MALYVVAESRARVRGLAAREPGRPRRQPSNADLERGQQIFLGSACEYCHTIAGTNASGTIGPDLTHIASRLSIGAGTLPNNEGDLAGWILDPQHFKPDNKMPGTALTGAELQPCSPTSRACVDGEARRRAARALVGGAGGFVAALKTVDHKRIGIRYLVTASVFFALGGIEALVMRVQLAGPNERCSRRRQYDQLFSMHGITMIFLFVTPMLSGFGNYLVPLQIGARDMAFPRLNASRTGCSSPPGSSSTRACCSGSRPTTAGSPTRRSRRLSARARTSTSTGSG